MCEPDIIALPGFSSFYHFMGTIGVACGLVTACAYILYCFYKRGNISLVAALQIALCGVSLPAAIGLIGAAFFPEKLLGCIENLPIYILAGAISMILIIWTVLFPERSEVTEERKIKLD